MSLYRIDLSRGPDKFPVQLAVCVRTIDGNLEDEEMEELEISRQLLGTCAAIFLLPPVPTGADNSVNILNVLVLFMF